MQDLSSLAKDSMWVTSQAGGNMQSSTEQAMTAPGSVPVDPLPDRTRQGDPAVDLGDRLPVGTPPRKADGSYTPSPREWKKTEAANG